MIETGIRDNHERGTVGEFLSQNISERLRLSIVSAYFTTDSYKEFRAMLDSIDSLGCLFGEQTFVSRIDPDKNQSKAFTFQGSKLHLNNRLQQKLAAKECARWIRNKVEIRNFSCYSTSSANGKWNRRRYVMPQKDVNEIELIARNSG